MNLKISYDSLADVCVYQDVISRSHGMCFECAGSVPQSSSLGHCRPFGRGHLQEDHLQSTEHRIDCQPNANTY